MKNNFDFNQDLKLILYGINNYAEEKYEILKRKGFQVIAFFDRRASELNRKYRIPVFTLEEEGFEAKDEICVIIMLQNAMQHDAIARDLLKKGYCKILFIPMNDYIEITAATNLREYYNYFMQEEWGMLHNIPILQKNLLFHKIDYQYSIIKRSDNWIKAWIPIELIYTNPHSAVEGRKKLEKYADVPISAYYPYIEMFKYLEGESASLQYLEEYGVNSCHYSNGYVNLDIILQRRRLYDIYLKEINRGMDFFISSAPTVKWNDRGFFNLLEGQHRIAFLWSKEYTYIPASLSCEDFFKWDNKKQLEKFICYIKNSGIRTLCTPLPHPMFKGFPAIKEHVGKTILSIVQSYLDSDMLVGKSVLDISGFQGYFGRNAYRMGAESVCIFENENIEIVNQLNKIQQMEDIKICTRLEELAGKEVEIVFALDYFYRNVDMGDRIQLIKNVSSICKEKIFCAIAEEETKQIIFEYTNFDSYQILTKKIEECGMVEIGVFYHNYS